MVEFISSRARVHLERLTAFGPRPTGSWENEVMAVNYIIGALEGIKSIADINTENSLRYFQKLVNNYILNIVDVNLYDRPIETII